MNPHDVLVRDLARQQELLLEPALEHRGGRGIRGDFRADDLEGDDYAELGIPRLVDGPHAADAEQANDVVAGAEGLARRQRTGRPVVHLRRGTGGMPSRVASGSVSASNAGSSRRLCRECAAEK